LVEAGCFAIVLEKVAGRLAERVTRAIPIVTIGIGSGPHCDGQVLVLADILGLDPDLHLRHAKRYADVGVVSEEAIRQYAEEVRSGAFPAEAHTFPGDDDELPTPERVQALVSGITKPS
jgi:3-methyl-2-oxobutanoate hydroxymethyltransferase